MPRTHLPELDKERSLRKWEEWGKLPPPPPAAPKSYLASTGRAPVAEPAPIVAPTKAKRSAPKKVRRK